MQSKWLVYFDVDNNSIIQITIITCLYILICIIQIHGMAGTFALSEDGYWFDACGLEMRRNEDMLLMS